MAVATASHAESDWKLGTVVKISPKEFLPTASPEQMEGINLDTRVLWRVKDSKLQFSVVSEFPTLHPELLKSYVVSFVSMWAEITHWRNWNPLLGGYIPQFLQEPRADFITWEEVLFVKWLAFEQRVGQMHRLFSRDGVYVHKTSYVTDASDPRWLGLQRRPGGPPLRMQKAPESNLMAVLCGEKKAVVVIRHEIQLLWGMATMVKMIVHAATSWVFPHIVKRMFRVGVDIFTNRTYTDAHEADALGLYARLLQTQEAGTRLEQQRQGRHACTLGRDAFREGELARRVSELEG